MARTRVERYRSTSSNNIEKALKESTNKMPSTSTSTSASASHTSSSSRDSVDSSPSRRQEVVTSMRRFLAEEDEVDYLESLTSKSKHSSSRSMPKYPRRKIQSSHTKSAGIPEDKEQNTFPEGRERNISTHSSRHRRSNVPPNTRNSALKPRSMRSKPRSIRAKNSTSDVHEGNLNDQKPSAQSLMASARRLLDKAARAASPGRLRNDRSSSPGSYKTKNKIEGNRPGSPTSNGTAPSSGEGVASSSNSETPNMKPCRLKRADSEGGSGEKPKSTRSKKRAESPDSGEKPKSSRSKKRPESPGRMKKRSQRSQSPGKLKKRSQSPGALRKTTRQRRRPENRDNRNRAQSNGPMKKPERASSHGRASSVSRRTKRDDGPSKPLRSTRSAEDDDRESSEVELPLKKDQSYSDMQDELNRYKVKRNKSMDAARTHRARRAAEKLPGDEEESEDESRQPPRRANSMMLSREMGRRGKTNSLTDLVQYKEEEIHSTSYFASNHVLINRERMKRGLRPLTRNIAMDEVARKSAEKMAESTGVTALPTTYVGNMLRGKDIRSIHRSTMLQKQGRERQNMLNPYFQDFGVGTCKGKDGTLFMCQLFSERLEITLTDTTTDTPPED